MILDKYTLLSGHWSPNSCHDDIPCSWSRLQFCHYYSMFLVNCVSFKVSCLTATSSCYNICGSILPIQQYWILWHHDSMCRRHGVFCEQDLSAVVNNHSTQYFIPGSESELPRLDDCYEKMWEFLSLVMSTPIELMATCVSTFMSCYTVHPKWLKIANMIQQG